MSLARTTLAADLEREALSRWSFSDVEPRVLLITADRLERTAFANLLRAAGYEVMLGASTEDLRRAVHHAFHHGRGGEPFDLIITDAAPGPDSSIDVTVELRRDAGDVPCIWLVHELTTELVNDALDLNIDVIWRPVTPRRLLVRAASLCAAPRLNEAFSPM